MNRRNFLRNLLVAGAGFNILPAALTYKRTWHKRKMWLMTWQKNDAGIWVKTEEPWDVAWEATAPIEGLPGLQIVTRFVVQLEDVS